MVGHGNRAFEVFRRTCPVFLEEISEIHRTEPYVYCQMVAGRDAATFGEGKNSWLTGTAAWTFTAVSQYILGVQPALSGLRIDPCIPAAWKGFSVERRGKSHPGARKRRAGRIGAGYHGITNNPALAHRNTRLSAGILCCLPSVAGLFSPYCENLSLEAMYSSSRKAGVRMPGAL